MATDFNSLLQFAGSGGLAGVNALGAYNDAQDRTRQNQIVDLKLGAAQQQAQHEAQFDTDYADYERDPTTDKLARLSIKYPDRADAVKQVWSMKDQQTRTSQINLLGPIYSLLQNGKTEDALSSLRAAREAAANSPADQAELDHEISLLSAGDEGGVNAVKANLMMHLAAADPDGTFGKSIAAIQKAYSGGNGEAYTLTPGSKRFDANNREVAAVPVADKPDYVWDADRGTFFLKPGTGGGGQASSGAGGSPSLGGRTTGGWTPRARNGGDNDDAAVDSKITEAAQFLGVDPGADLSTVSPMKIAQAMTLSEGGPGSLADRNNNPTNLRNGDGTYKKFPTKEAGLAAAAALVSRKLKRGQTSVRTLIEGLPAAESASARVPALQGAVQVAGAKPGYTVLTPQEKQTLGLPPSVAYQRSASGEVSAISGQDTKTQQAQAVPASMQKSILDNHGSLRALNQAITLLDKHKGSVGFGTGSLGERFTNWRDADGIQTRAAIGKVGGLIIHDLSGAAVTASEAPRFSPYVPSITDSADTALKKLRQLKVLAEGDQADLRQAYGPENGYRGVKLPGDPVQVRSVQEAAKLPKGTKYVRPDGTVMVR